MKNYAAWSLELEAWNEHHAADCSTKCIRIFYLLIIYKYMEIFFSSKRKSPIHCILWIFYYAILIFPATKTILPPQIYLLINAVMVFLISTISFKGSLKKHGFFAIMICAVCMAIEVGVGVFLEILGITGVSLQIAGSFITEILMILYAVIAEQFTRKSTKRDISLKYILAISIIPAGSIYLMHNVFLIVCDYRKYSAFAVISSVLLLIINYLIFEIYKWLIKDAELKQVCHFKADT